jgi:hypothetical protein
MDERFYHDAIAERSWRTLLELHKRYDFVLIGGWAAWLYARGAKSRDIDMVVDYDGLARLRADYQVRKNARLRKYEIKADGFDIDIYVPHYSITLAVPPEFVMTRVQIRDGFRVPDPETLLALKLGAWNERRGSAKGSKDELDIRSLLPFVSRERFAAMLAESGMEEGRARTLKGLLDEIPRTTR